jgi:cytochrome c
MSLPEEPALKHLSFGVFVFGITCVVLAACGNQESYPPRRPRDPWVFRSVLDKKPRMLTIALDSECYVSYDLARCTLYKAWKGGVMLEGAAFTDKKNVQPTSWGTSYFPDTLTNFQWVCETAGGKTFAPIVSRGYVLKGNQILLRYHCVLPSTDTVLIEERPEFIRQNGRIGLERSFTTSGMPEGVGVSLMSGTTRYTLPSNATTRLTAYFRPLPSQTAPLTQQEYDHRGRYWIEKSDCLTCHEFDKKTVGPSFLEIAQRYSEQEGALQTLGLKIKEGGTGVWGNQVMNPHPRLSAGEIRTMLDYIFSLKPKSDSATRLPAREMKTPAKNKPGFGAALAGVHPSYDLSTIRPRDFQPRVGGLAFLPDGRLLVTTWDSTGAVYMLTGVETGDAGKVSVKRIATGLAEPLGIDVVDGKIFVLQKQELTRLIDHDGDEIIDEYRAICNTWSVTGDFHEFAFGLIYKDGYFYATLSLAMRLMSEERQQPDRGKTIRIGMDGKYEWINHGLRTPNGIGIGFDDQLFVTDNQGEWIPANKLIHLKKGDYHGMPWGLSDTLSKPPRVAPPVIWLPEDEIANSPSEPTTIQDGPYKGQMLHGDVTHGGIKRDFIEKVNGEYQGAVFRFSQGLEGGVNRLRWGPDGALYVGCIGMVGGWSWKETKFGLQRLKYNGKTTFEMLAVRARPRGFEIEFTEAVAPDVKLQGADFTIQQWWYLPTEDYGGPKMDLEKLKITKLNLSEDGKHLYLEIQGLKKEHVVYFRLPDNLKSRSGQSLWSSEAWYTLNNFVE